MSRTSRAKQERIIEAVRQGLEGDDAIEFVRQSGYAMTQAGIARHLRSMGGRGRIQELIDKDMSNIEALYECFPDEELLFLHKAPPDQPDLFKVEEFPKGKIAPDLASAGMFDSRKIAVRLPADLYEALRLAAKAEGKSQNELIIDMLNTNLGQMSIKEPAEKGE